MIRVGAASFRWLAGAVALSLAGHALSILALPGVPAIHVSRTPPRVDEVELIFEPLPPEPALAAVALPPVTAPETSPSRPDVTRVPNEPAPAPLPTTPDPVTQPQAAEPRPTVVEPQPEDPRATAPAVEPGRIVRLDATAAARSVLDFGGPRQPRAAAAEPDVESVEARDARLTRQLDSTLLAAANARPEGFGRRELPQAQHRPNGTLAYALGQVTAIVNPDGTFTFDDTAGVHFDGVGGAQRDGIQASWGLEEWMMRRHGNDPHAATRRWFANQTQDMRDGMEQRYMESLATRHAARTRVRLDRVMADEALAIEERRRRIFATWDECAEGELVGDAVRAAVITYVRHNLARGSELAYPDSELDTLNRGRTGTAEFRPYAN